LTRWDAFLFLLSLDGILDRDVLLNTQLLHVFMELIYAGNHVCSVMLKLLVKVLLVNCDFTVIKVLLSGDFFSSSLTIDLPILFALVFPLFVERLVLLHYSHRFLSLSLLHTSQHVYLLNITVMSILFEVHSGQLVFK
jgi:hypothetical protein